MMTIRFFIFFVYLPLKIIVCYREIVKKYGFDKWYYPDVNCPLVKQQIPVLNDE